jgi:hypothetical protein
MGQCKPKRKHGVKPHFYALTCATSRLTFTGLGLLSRHIDFAPQTLAKWRSGKYAGKQTSPSKGNVFRNIPAFFAASLRTPGTFSRHLCKTVCLAQKVMTGNHLKMVD